MYMYVFHFVPHRRVLVPHRLRLVQVNFTLLFPPLGHLACVQL